MSKHYSFTFLLTILLKILWGAESSFIMLISICCTIWSCKVHLQNKTKSYAIILRPHPMSIYAPFMYKPLKNALDQHYHYNQFNLKTNPEYYNAVALSSKPLSSSELMVSDCTGSCIKCCKLRLRENANVCTCYLTYFVLKCPLGAAGPLLRLRNNNYGVC